MGEFTRINLRRNCLNSKTGYARSGISRLTFQLEDKEHQEKTFFLKEGESRKDGFQSMTKGVPERAKGAGNRDFADDDPSRKSKRRKKLKHQVLDEDWSLMDDEPEEFRNCKNQDLRLIR